MTKEDKDLLLRYLSMALPYELRVELKYSDEHGSHIRDNCCKKGVEILNPLILDLFSKQEIHIKPYLRPMSSMTEEERTEINTLIKQNSPSPCGKINLQGMDNLLYSVVVSSGFLMDWMLNKHFDIFDLISKELAIAVTEENSPYNTAEE